MLTERTAAGSGARAAAALALALLATLALGAGPAAAQDDRAALQPHEHGRGDLTATPAPGFSTIAITVVGGPAGGAVVFTPARGDRARRLHEQRHDLDDLPGLAHGDVADGDRGRRAGRHPRRGDRAR